jgi:hypothetical protein
VPVAEVARRVGNSPEVIHRVYEGCIYGQEAAMNKKIEAELAWPKTVSYVVRRTLFRYGAGNVELDRAGRLVGDRQATDSGAEDTAAGRRDAEHA